MSCLKIKVAVHFLRISVCLLLSRPFGNTGFAIACKGVSLDQQDLEELGMAILVMLKDKKLLQILFVVFVK